MRRLLKKWSPPVKRGWEYLKGEQYDDGSWDFEGHRSRNHFAVCDGVDRERGLGLRPIIDKAHRFGRRRWKTRWDV